MKVYVLTQYIPGELPECYGVYSSIEKAKQVAIKKDKYNENNFEIEEYELDDENV